MAPTTLTEYLSNDNKIEPPGGDRSLPEPTRTGRIPFEYAPTGLKGETSYKLWGDLSSSKTPLICLHGGPGVPAAYIVNMSLLHVDYGIPVILYDQVGCGASTRYPEKKGDHSFWPVDLFIAENANLRKHLGIKTFDLYGQSWGGMLSGEIAITQPEGLRKVIVSNSPADMPSWVRAANEQRTGLPKDVIQVLDECEAREGGLASPEYMEATMKFYQKHMCRLETWPQPLMESFGMLEHDNTVYETMQGPNEFLVVGSLRTWDIREGLKTVTEKTVPGGMLVLNGFYDTAQDFACEAFFWNPSCRTKWVKFMLSAHFPHLEETEKYMKTVGDFLTKE